MKEYSLWVNWLHGGRIHRSIGAVGLFLACACVLSAQASSSSIANLSARGTVGQGTGSLVAGFVIGGSGSKTVLVRGAGPSLAAFDVPNPAASVSIRVHDARGNVVAVNDGYQSAPNAVAVAATAAQLGAFPITHSGDSALLATLTPGGYSVEAVASAANPPNGTALLEVYDVDVVSGTRTGSTITNVSSRGMVSQGSGELIAGFVIEGTASKNLLIRGAGRSLSAFGLPNPAANVSVRVRAASGTVVASSDANQPMADTVFAVQIAANLGGFPLSSSGETSTVVLLSPGAYTIEVVPSTANSPDGVALLEVYDADGPGGVGSLSLGEADNGKTFTVAANTQIAVTLQSNASTGYQWTLVTAPDPRVVQLVSTVEQPPKSGMPGAAGTVTWTFRAVGSGATTVKLAYQRPFAPQDNPTSYSFTVQVK